MQKVLVTISLILWIVTLIIGTVNFTTETAEKFAMNKQQYQQVKSS
jgi:hypothetical protein